MSRLLYKISFPIVLTGIFTISIFIAINYNSLQPSFYVTLLLLTFFTFFFGYAVGKNVTLPIKELLSKAKELRDGNVSTRVYLETKDEMAELAKTLNQIAAELELSHEEKKQAQELIDISVRARTKDLEEIIKSLEQKVRNRTQEFDKLVEDSKRFQTQIKEKEAQALKLNRDIDILKNKVSKHSSHPSLGKS